MSSEKMPATDAEMAQAVEMLGAAEIDRLVAVWNAAEAVMARSIVVAASERAWVVDDLLAPEPRRRLASFGIGAEAAYEVARSKAEAWAQTVRKRRCVEAVLAALPQGV